MPKKYRLSRADFTNLSRPARRIHGTFFSLTITPLPSSKGPRAACVVSKKVSARSVDRNRVERLCRECLRPHLARIEDSLALVFHAKREAREASHADVARDIEKMLRTIDARDAPR